MTSLYVPRGFATPYAKLAVNLYSRCPHACRYCYCPRVLHIPGYEFYDVEPKPRTGLICDLEHACHEWAATSDERPPVHLSFIGDPLPVHGDDETAIAVIQTLKRYLFPVQILSKSGFLPDTVLTRLDERDAYGITLTSMSERDCRYWEPFAATPLERLAALHKAKLAGLKGWVSLEPVLDLVSAAPVLQALAQTRVDWVWAGPLNHLTRPYQWSALKRELQAIADPLRLPMRWKDEETGTVPQRVGRSCSEGLSPFPIRRVPSPGLSPFPPGGKR